VAEDRVGHGLGHVGRAWGRGTIDGQLSAFVPGAQLADHLLLPFLRRFKEADHRGGAVHCATERPVAAGAACAVTHHVERERGERFAHHPAERGHDAGEDAIHAPPFAVQLDGLVGHGRRFQAGVDPAFGRRFVFLGKERGGAAQNQPGPGHQPGRTEQLSSAKLLHQRGSYDARGATQRRWTSESLPFYPAASRGCQWMV